MYNSLDHPLARPAQSQPPAAAGRLASVFSARLGALLGTWSARTRQRRELAALDDRLLRDVGLSRETALREAEKPFWRR
ncbi:DUF1127 domain-containing protein [Pseudothauera nasutitermitis]|uniref:DUF1127 domain-containing protein n=1 Tax=Pseudothauera nasutitermitis TaxID=2565930 RepID=A0A4S4AXR3_9RHOO|nr:DUF1127 domain-containing protein [Pseudothauera nasutitermitis]THF64913.1 DUF1127 domain-containing protein [Pseudothauera nasutitermitis]